MQLPQKALPKAFRKTSVPPGACYLEEGIRQVNHLCRSMFCPEHYSSTKSKTGPCTSIYIELFAAIHLFAFVKTLRMTINEIFYENVLLNIFAESKSLYDGNFVKNVTTEKRLSTLCVCSTSQKYRVNGQIP